MFCCQNSVHLFANYRLLAGPLLCHLLNELLFLLLGLPLDRSYLLLSLCDLTFELFVFDEQTLTFTRSRRQLSLEVLVFDEDSLGRTPLLPSLLQVLLYKHILLLQNRQFLLKRFNPAFILCFKLLLTSQKSIFLGLGRLSIRLKSAVFFFKFAFLCIKFGLTFSFLRANIDCLFSDLFNHCFLIIFKRSDLLFHLYRCLCFYLLYSLNCLFPFLFVDLDLCL